MAKYYFIHSIVLTEGKHIDQEAISRILKLLEVKPLSQSVDTMSVTENFKQLPSLQDYTRRVIPYLQLLLINEYEEFYQIHLSHSIAEHLAAMSFASVIKTSNIHDIIVTIQIDAIIHN